VEGGQSTRHVHSSRALVTLHQTNDLGKGASSYVRNVSRAHYILGQVRKRLVHHGNEDEICVNSESDRSGTPRIMTSRWRL
jgi:hypothetical protein